MRGGIPTRLDSLNATYPPGPRDRQFGRTFHEAMRRDAIGFASKVAEEHGDFAFVRIGWVRLYFVNRPSSSAKFWSPRREAFTS